MKSDTRLAEGIHKSTVRVINEKFTEKFTKMLHIPKDKKDTVIASEEYKDFINECCGLRDKMLIDEKKRISQVRTTTIAEGLAAIWKSSCELLDSFGLLPETMQVSTLKESSNDWTKFVAQKGSEIVREHKLSLLN